MPCVFTVDRQAEKTLRMCVQLILLYLILTPWFTAWIVYEDMLLFYDFERRDVSNWSYKQKEIFAWIDNISRECFPKIEYTRGEIYKIISSSPCVRTGYRLTNCTVDHTLSFIHISFSVLTEDHSLIESLLGEEVRSPESVFLFFSFCCLIFFGIEREGEFLCVTHPDRSKLQKCLQEARDSKGKKKNPKKTRSECSKKRLHRRGLLIVTTLGS